jgi:2-C-methyl-D-erythritol 2,4-cyclodiphosphate synthase
MVREKGFHIVNVDSTIVAQKPKLSEVIPKMVQQIAEVLEIEPSRVNVKATTTEGLGFAGRGEGIAAYAIALVGED